MEAKGFCLALPRNHAFRAASSKRRFLRQFSGGNCGSLGRVALQSRSIPPYPAQRALPRRRGKTGRGQLTGQAVQGLFWLPHTVRRIWPRWDRLVETRTLMRYGSADVKKRHFQQQEQRYWNHLLFWKTHTYFLLSKCLTFLLRLTEITQLIPP